MVIPTYNGRGLLERCLASIAQHRPTDPGITIEVIVVRRRLDRRHGRVAGSASIPTCGWSGSSGTAASARPPTPASPRREAGSFSCSTTTPRSPPAGSRRAWLRLPTRPSARSRRWCWCGPSPARVDSAGDSLQLDRLADQARPRPARRSFAERAVEEVFGASGSSAFYRSAALLKRLGAIDALLGSYYEDIDLAFRLRWAGYRCLFAPSCVIFHDVSATYDHTSPALQRRMARNAELVFWANLPGMLLAFAVLPHLMLLVHLQALWRLASGKLGAFLLGKCRRGICLARDPRAPPQSAACSRRSAVFRPHFTLSAGSLRDVANHLSRPTESSTMLPDASPADTAANP